MVQAHQSPFVLTVGNETEGGSVRAYLRVWSVVDAGFGAPEGEIECARAIRVFGSTGTEPPITCLAVADDVSQVAMGLEDGGVLLLRTTDLVRERFLRLKPLTSFMLGVVGAAQGTPSASPITGVHFCRADDGRTPTDLWVITEGEVRCVSGAGLRSESCRDLAVGGVGARVGCSCVSHTSHCSSVANS